MLDEAAKSLITQGGVWAALWVFTVMGMGSAIVYLQRKLNACQTDLVNAVRAFGEVVTNNTVVMSQHAQENARRVAANESLVNTITMMTTRMDSMSEKIAESAREARDTRNVVAELGRSSGRRT